MRRTMSEHAAEIGKIRKQSANLPEFIKGLEHAGYEVEYADYGVLNVYGWMASKFNFTIKITENLSTAGKSFYVTIPNRYICN